MKNSLELGLIGNCRIGALIDERGEIVWSCLPRFDGDPVFCSLLNEHPDGEGAGYLCRRTAGSGGGISVLSAQYGCPGDPSDGQPRSRH